MHPAGSPTGFPTGGATDLHPQPRIRVRAATKTFDGTAALNEVSFDVRRGEIHALLGANGAGKSTLIKALAGFYQLDSGTIEVHAEADGSRHGVAFIHQDLALIPDLSVAENIAMVAGYPRRAGRVDWKGVRAQAQAALGQVGGGIALETKVDELNRADQSIVALARALFTDCAAIVLDEPTASLPDADVERLFEILRELRGRGVSVLYVTHRLDEVRRIADHVTVLRDGQVVADRRIDDISDLEIVGEIVGGTVTPYERRAAGGSGTPVLSLADGAISATTGPLNFDLHGGEILGLAGLRGSGQEQAGRAVAGVAPLHRARFTVAGRPAKLDNVKDALRHGIGFATSRRESEALAMTLTVRENLYLNPRKGRRYNPLSRPARERRAAARLIADVRLRPDNAEAVIATLSGGNQQKVVLGRWLEADLRALVLEEPTMGIDVGARAEIYGLLQRLASKGLGIVVVSSDFEELATICDRALIFNQGVIHAELAGEDVRVDRLTYLASGGSAQAGDRGV